MAGARAASGLPWDVACGARSEAFSGACTYGTVAQQRHSPMLPELMTWDVARTKAEETLKRMSGDQKTSLLQGIGWATTQWWYDLQKWFYVGNTPAIPELGLPSLNMQDASDGFRTYWTELKGTATVWPSILALAATWDPVAVQDFGVALGKEFAGKGANVVLGPGVQVQRVARCGRSFEYLAGDDPFLGAMLTKAYVRGVQSQGVLAIVKHWVFNSQETNRGGENAENSVVDNKTARELYFPPFAAAIEAGVGGAMCSYNKVDGKYSCSNSHMLKDVLKGELGFQGFVQSDWWALHEPSFLEGLDQEMPGKGPELFLSAENTSEHPERLNDAVLRILAAIYKVNLPETSSCSPPNCTEWFKRDVASASHAALAKSLTVDSVVLLKNEDQLLPINKTTVRKIAIIGSVAVSDSYDPAGVGQGMGMSWFSGDYYSGGGSGHMTGNVIKTLDGLSARATLEGISVIASPTDNITEATEAAREADIAIVVVGATSGESVDRPNLQLERGGDELIANVASVSPKTVVLMQVCGAVLMPWRQNVSSILTMFLGGQETGSAWASVLFGDASPSGRLPIMMPETEADSIPPSENETIVYSEGLATSYRNTDFKAAFPFGHGLSYTDFRYSTPEAVECPYHHQLTSSPILCIKATVENVGARPSRTVAQLYLEFPPEAGQPVAILKGFQKTTILQPGASTDVLFPLSEKELSYWNSGSWTRVKHVTAYLAESSWNKFDSVQLEIPAASTFDAGVTTTHPLSFSSSMRACWPVLLLGLSVKF